ncbi:urease accessory protein [Nakamurella flavida]|nr:urease accessory protein UreD [Nakamurella flavida]MDP9779370.1 urease accessory protein [Nakamurella flavida]
MRVTDTGASVALVATGALLLGGDHVDVALTVGPGAWLEVVEIAGTVAYDAAGEASSWTVRASVEAGGTLVWSGEPFVVADGANTVRTLDISLAQGATATVRDVLVLGRTGERGGAVRSVTRADLAGHPLLAEDLDLADPVDRGLTGVLGAARVLDTIAVLGRRLAEVPADAPADPGSRFELAGPGTLLRSVRSETAGSPLLGVWPGVRAAALS